MKKHWGRVFLAFGLLAGFSALSFGASDLQVGFSLSGGLSLINGGDFNEYIRAQNAWAADNNSYYGDHYSIDWKELKSLPSFGGEVFVRFGRNIGVGLGVEYLKKSNPGTMNFASEDVWSTPWYGLGYYVSTLDVREDWVYAQSLSAIPITLSLYGFLPLGANFEGYVKAGAGYYLGKLTTDLTDSYAANYNETWHHMDGSLWPPHYNLEATEDYAYTLETTCNTIGFHFGAGFNFNVTGNIALFGEAFYRLVNFKDWQGDGTMDYSYRIQDQWTDEPSPFIETGSSTDSWTGKLWSFDDIWDNLATGSYLQYWLYKAGDEPTENVYTANVRPTEINLNGFNFKVGIRISFGPRR